MVSILMPVRDAALTLPLALQTIFAQTFADWELILIDDGSQDATPEILADCARRDPRVRLLTQPPHGIAAALQRGCAIARGEFIARMDADDLMARERLQSQTEFLRASPEVGLVSCLVRHGGHPQQQAGYAAHVRWINSLKSSSQIELRRFVEAPVAHPTVMFRREFLTQHGGYREGDFPEDYELWLRWLDAGVRFEKLDVELLVWNDRPNRLSRADPRYRAEAFYQIKCQYLARWLKRHIDPRRPLWLWGAGRITRKRFQWLEREGLRITGFIDIDPLKSGALRDGRPVLMPQQLPQIRNAFILAGVGTRGARDLIAAELNRVHGLEGKDYLLAA